MADGGLIPMGALPYAAEAVRRAGRGKDKVLAHITPREAARLDAIQGGPRINPATGVREYGFFDDIGDVFDDVGDFLGDAAQAVVPVAGGILGGVLGGPFGAAAGSAIGTLLTGGSLDRALLNGAIGGIGAFAGPKLMSGLGGMFGSGTETGEAIGGLAGGADAVANTTAPPAEPGILTKIGDAFTSPLALLGLGGAALAGGLGGTIGGKSNAAPTAPGGVPQPQAPFRQGTLEPRSYVPYAGDYSTYGQVGGGLEHQFYNTVNPGIQWYAGGGQVDPFGRVSNGRIKDTLGREVLRAFGDAPAIDDETVQAMQAAAMLMPGMARQAQLATAPQTEFRHPWQLPQPVPQPGPGMVGEWQQAQMPPQMFVPTSDPARQRVNNLLWASQSSGKVVGPGDGQSDSIPAMLSNGEYVLPADVVAALGSGSSDAGADRMDRFVKNIRKQRNAGGMGLPPSIGNITSYMGGGRA